VAKLVAVLILPVLLLTAATPALAGQTDTLPSDIPADYRPATADSDYIRREAMIPMRDGVRPYTLIR
jgi:predicted acyl esterase